MVLQTNIKVGSSCCFWKCYKNLKTSNISPSELAFPVSPTVNQVQGIAGGLNFEHHSCDQFKTKIEVR